MLKDIEKLLIKGNFQFQSKIIQNPEIYSFEEKIPKYPILILTCMDPRIDIYRIFQLKPGDVFILRNAGNIFTQDILRSILLAIFEYDIKCIIVLGHLECGMTRVKLTELKMKLPPELLPISYNKNLDLFSKIRQFFKPFIDELRNIKEQVETLEKFQEFLPKIEITGMLYDIHTGWVFEYEKFKEYAFIQNFRRQYNTILSEKKYQFIDFLDKIEHEIANIEDLKEFSQESELNEIETEKLSMRRVDEDLGISTISGRNEKSRETSTKEHEEFKLNQDDKIQTIMPKIKIPKIRFHGVKIYIPKILREKREIMNKN